jgi:membrane associated rhomboid family serine protease
MLDDRDYMRGSSYGSQRPMAVILCAVLIAVYLVQLSLYLFAPQVPVLQWLALSLDGIKHGYLWQPLTFQFLHEVPWPWHVLMNCLGLYFLGRAVEDFLGKLRFLLLYFASGLCGAAVQLLASLLLPSHAHDYVVGASAGVMGLLAAFATLFPMQQVTVFVIVFPVTLRAQYLLWAALAFSVYGMLFPYSHVADAAHLGGLLFGVAYIRWGNNAQRQISRFSPFQSRQRKLELVKAASVSTLRSSRPRKDAATDLPSDEFISREVDPILDKISAHGIQSLTDRERQILEAARSRMSRR